ncbi:MAG: hypothetical protein WDZ63_06145 [Burkholderiales bacterium]
MSIKIQSKELSAAESSFLKWQYGFEDEDDPFERSLWQTIARAWESDNQPGISGKRGTRHLERLGSTDAYPEEVSLYVRFKSDRSDDFWSELIRRAGLSDRRQRRVAPKVERRREEARR